MIYLTGDTHREFEWIEEQLQELLVTLLCIHGNHEKRPESIDTYEDTELNSGIVYRETEFPDLLFAKDGEIYGLDGWSCVAIGGAYSIDKFHRIAGVSWWPDEQPSEEIIARVETRLKAEKWKVDAVFSHTCPYKYIPREAFLPNIRQHTVDTSTEEWLDSIEDRLDYSMWYCGHYHMYKLMAKCGFFTKIIQSYFDSIEGVVMDCEKIRERGGLG